MVTFNRLYSLHLVTIQSFQYKQLSRLDMLNNIPPCAGVAYCIYWAYLYIQLYIKSWAIIFSDKKTK